jgi:TRAP-type C4-dicarboxylate transport system permease small subunit
VSVVLRKATRALYRVVQALSVLFLAGMAATVCFVVFTRYALNNSPRWGEEVALLCMVWFSLLSAALPIWDNRHIRITAWDLILPPRILRVLELVVHLILVAIIALMGWYGIELLEFVAKSRMSGTGISFIYLYGAVPVSAVFMLVAGLQRLGEIFVDKP